MQAGFNGIVFNILITELDKFFGWYTTSLGWVMRFDTGAGASSSSTSDTNASKNIFRTVDGIERFTQVNYLGGFYLTKLLWNPLLRAANSTYGQENPGAVRVVLTTSLSHWEAKRGVDFSDEAWTKEVAGSGSSTATTTITKEYNKHGESKLMALLFMRKLAQRLEEKNKRKRLVNISATCCHVGKAETNLRKRSSQTNMMNSVLQFLNPVSWFLPSPMPAEQACLSQVLCCVDEDVQNGSFYGPDHVVTGFPVEVSGRKYHESSFANNEAQMDELWTKSEKLIGEKFFVSTGAVVPEVR